MGEISFGTDGWRGIIAHDFTTANVARISRALASLVLREKENSGVPPLVLVGYDSRFMSPTFAHVVAHVMSEAGLLVRVSAVTVPTPTLSWAVRKEGAALGVMVTASHNPPEWNGIKVKGAYGGPALPEFTSMVEAELDNQPQSVAPELPRMADVLSREPGGKYELFSPLGEYLDRLQSFTSLTPMAVRQFHSDLGWSGERPLIVADAMYGAARGAFEKLFEPLGFNVLELHSECNPGLGGRRPEPLAAHLEKLCREVPRLGAVMGLATDGDGDRIGAVDEYGHFVDAQHIFALLVELLAGDRDCSGLVVKTFAVTELVDRLAEDFGLAVETTPIGFKHVCRLALEQEVLLGGEESGGIGIVEHVPERDGLLCGLLLAELVVRRGKTLSELIKELHGRYGTHVYKRLDLPLAPTARDRLMAVLAEEPPASFGGYQVARVDPLDGLKFVLEEGSWILFRPSGTEPLVRIYAEADGSEKLEKLLASGQEIARRVEK